MVTIDERLLWQVVNFLVLMWLLKRFLYGPLTEFLDKRSQKIKNELDSAARKKEEADKLKKEYESKLQQARDKAQEIIEDAEKRAQQRAEEIIAEARVEAKKVKERNMEEIAQAKRDALDELRKEVASISLMVAGKFIKEKIDKKQQEALINQYIENLDQEKIGELQ
ncbi:F0F1 ATP synthase subunit B [Halothermothrix orenii]|uniref:ATP synthase subunit b n=1 Tax=Halothermothrix orenii (strain H 168 / OCM 544 / DSM 9562) TaxID=373903 RepID=B8CZ14_HALOH|nr:F0F1 ATP synthase subunit B [Halothermothrix orenii]ACL70533.1 ATP synthase F0, B subunit [Halothermothrix orenii H 168]